ncbi:ROK family protein [Methanogenium organophilum]|uniref:ROK family protein n=1 Tax=Methanogenium organophilum TaxID=2199 RepID=A0A9X9S4A7_METOG|nr:ROK family protein [Methanogenium organophilum]WAI01411.1 ROK family protein [Methanogenium organophilum]
MKDKTGMYLAAADIGATHVRSGVFTGNTGGEYGDDVDEIQCVVLRKEALCRDGPDGRAVTEQVVRMIQTVCDEAGCQPDAVGISTAGPLSVGKESIRMSPNMPYPEIPLKGPLEATFPCPVSILNDASAGAYYECHRGEGQGCNNLVYLTISTGIGCGVISGGHLVEGANGNAGEAGHFCVDTIYNLPCGCGGRGHWEAYASGSGMPQFFRAWCGRYGHGISVGEVGTAETLCAAARAGDPNLTAFFRELAVINGRGLSTVIAAYAPEKIIVGGPVATENPELILAQAREYADAYLPTPDIVLSAADGMAPLIGAAVFAGESVENSVGSPSV